MHRPTIKEIFKFGIDFLKTHNIESPDVNTEMLLCWILNLSRIEIRLESDKIITEKQQKQFMEALKSRANHTPLQYIIGKISFYNITINVNKSVLIPRPETEELVKIIINNIHESCYQIRNILDIGTGSGCISIALGKEFTDIKIDGIDISASAINCANANKNSLNISNITFINADISDYQTNKKYDIIVSNPPYISIYDYEKLDKELFFEPKIALTDNNDGLTFYRMIADKSNSFLNKNGKIFLECGINQAEKIVSIFDNNKYKIQIVKDFAGIDRFIILEMYSDL
ncbi:MAG: peptide chain release factor N(5)-glutamine methyltransferase [Bacteroidetes bacterium]|nr:peptide chain release factor N(5)-glutamine methyltransferase [Bacteroidota bacterium]